MSTRHEMNMPRARNFRNKKGEKGYSDAGANDCMSTKGKSGKSVWLPCGVYGFEARKRKKGATDEI
jgi:hypothetical protein